MFRKKSLYVNTTTITVIDDIWECLNKSHSPGMSTIQLTLTFQMSQRLVIDMNHKLLRPKKMLSSLQSPH
jgi:hypothetical protein